jgi:hypothetical protein
MNDDRKVDGADYAIWQQDYDLLGTFHQNSPSIGSRPEHR